MVFIMWKQPNDHDTSESVRQWLDGAAVATIAVLGIAFTGSVLLLFITAILLGVGRQLGFR